MNLMRFFCDVELLECFFFLIESTFYPILVLYLLILE